MAYQTGKHALGDRARKIDQGILITRFELPFNIWWYALVIFSILKYICSQRRSGTCDNHIGMGVRYNAEKKKIGSYYSTPIFSFRCKCHLCDAWFEIHTDPKVCRTRNDILMIAQTQLTNQTRRIRVTLL